MLLMAGCQRLGHGVSAPCPCRSRAVAFPRLGIIWLSPLQLLPAHNANHISMPFFFFFSIQSPELAAVGFSGH